MISCASRDDRGNERPGRASSSARGRFKSAFPTSRLCAWDELARGAQQCVPRTARGLRLTSPGAMRRDARMSGYLDYSGRDDVLSGGSRMIPVSTSAGTFRVWTKRIGNNPDLKLLLLHGGPGCTHEYLEACDSYLPAAAIEYYYYDQL